MKKRLQKVNGKWILSDKPLKVEWPCKKMQAAQAKAEKAYALNEAEKNSRKETE